MPKPPFLHLDEMPTEEVGNEAAPGRRYPRRTTHRETIEYTYDPATQRYEARVVAATEPTVVGWDKSPLVDRDTRDVETWDVTPTNTGVHTEGGDVGRQTPAGIRAELRAKAKHEGGPSSLTKEVEVEHDIDTGETRIRQLERMQEDMARALNDRRREDLAERGRRRASARRYKEQQAATIPDVFITMMGDTQKRMY